MTPDKAIIKITTDAMELDATFDNLAYESLSLSIASLKEVT
jgi:hypothetical protein